MKVVLDTNILVSGLIEYTSSSGQVLRLALAAEVDAGYNPVMFQEYERVLRRPKFRFVEIEVERVLRQIEAEWMLVSTSPLSIPLPDKTDEPFLETAMAIRADALITGNLRHFPLAARQGIPVVGPAEFLARLYKAR